MVVACSLNPAPSFSPLHISALEAMVLHGQAQGDLSSLPFRTSSRRLWGSRQCHLGDGVVVQYFSSSLTTLVLWGLGEKNALFLCVWVPLVFVASP